MGMIYASIELINGDDLVLSRHNHIDVDPVVDKRKGQLANGHIVEYDVVGPVEVRFKNRRCSLNAMVLPGDNEPLLGAIALEDMDVVIHPQRHRSWFDSRELILTADFLPDS